MTFAAMIAGIVLLLAVWLILRWFATAEPRQVIAGLKWIGGGLLVVVVLTLAVTGRLGLLLPLAFLLLPLLRNWRMISNRMKAARGASPGQGSRIETGWLSAALDHDTGRMDAAIKRGPLAGRHLTDLSEDELLSLLSDTAQTDPQSARIVETFLDRELGPDWRERAGTHQPGSRGGTDDDGRRSTAGGSATMTVEEACAVLGVRPDADEPTIKAAHRKLMKQVHPDHGGSDYLAAKINQAKDVLLKRR